MSVRTLIYISKKNIVNYYFKTFYATFTLARGFLPFSDFLAQLCLRLAHISSWFFHEHLLFCCITKPCYARLCKDCVLCVCVCVFCACFLACRGKRDDPLEKDDGTDDR